MKIKENNFNLGLYKLTIRENPVYFIPDEAFVGLERSLWLLDLSDNELTQVPHRALRYMQKLRFLDLTGIKSIYLLKSKKLKQSKLYRN